MKFLTFILLLCTGAAFSQSQIGIYAGYADAKHQYSSDVEIPADGDPTINAYTLGVVFTKKISEHFYVESRWGLARRGAACVPGFTGVGPVPEPFEGDNLWLIDYAEWPITVGYMLGSEDRKVNFSVAAGYGTAYAVKATERILDFTENSEQDSDLAIGTAGRIHRLDYGVYTGARVMVNFLKFSTFVEADYYMGMRNVDRTAHSRNRVFSVNLGVVCSVW